MKGSSQGLTGNLTTDECSELGFATVMYPCTGFIPAMLAMQRSYGMLKEKKSDLAACEGKQVSETTIPPNECLILTLSGQIKNFFEQVGLKAAFDFDSQVVQHIKKDVPSQKYENLTHHDLF